MHICGAALCPTVQDHLYTAHLWRPGGKTWNEIFIFAAMLKISLPLCRNRERAINNDLFQLVHLLPCAHSRQVSS